jgi:hypothetical protein
VTAVTDNTDYTERVELQWTSESSGCAVTAVIDLQIRDTMSAHSVLYLTTIYSKSMFSSQKKKRSPSNSAPANGLASQSQASQQLRFPTKSQSHLQSPQQAQQSQPVYPWSVHTPPSGRWPSPFPLRLPALSTTATAAGDLFLFGGSTHSRACNDLYVISTRDFSTTLLQTSGDVPNPRYGHRAVLTSTTLLIWGGRTDFNDLNAQDQRNDDSFYLLNLGTSDLYDVKTRSS